MPSPRPPKRELVKVRCLGAGPEHSFLSRDKVTERICGRCREKMASVGVSLRDRPVFVRAEE